MDCVEAAVLASVQRDLTYGDLSVQQARLMLLSASMRPLRSQEVARLIRVLDGMSRDIQADAQLFRAAAHLVEARERGNACDLWRAVGKIEALVGLDKRTSEEDGES